MGWEISPRQCAKGAWEGGSSPRVITSAITSGTGAIMGYISGSGIGSAARTRGLAASRMGAPSRMGAASRALAASVVLLVLLPGASPVSDLRIQVADLRSAKGMVRVCLTADPSNFPACIDDARAVTRSVPAGVTAIAFDGLPYGDYAFAVIHDENGNNRLDTMLGIPKEGFGFSRNPAITFGAPRFTAARFTLDSDAEKQQVRMKYML